MERGGGEHLDWVREPVNTTGRLADPDGGLVAAGTLVGVPAGEWRDPSAFPGLASAAVRGELYGRGRLVLSEPPET
jgi:hypothetical protein